MICLLVEASLCVKYVAFMPQSLHGSSRNHAMALLNPPATLSTRPGHDGETESCEESTQLLGHFFLNLLRRAPLSAPAARDGPGKGRLTTICPIFVFRHALLGCPRGGTRSPGGLVNEGPSHPYL